MISKIAAMQRSDLLSSGDAIPFIDIGGLYQGYMKLDELYQCEQPEILNDKEHNVIVDTDEGMRLFSSVDLELVTINVFEAGIRFKDDSEDDVMTVQICETHDCFEEDYIFFYGISKQQAKEAIGQETSEDWEFVWVED